MQHKISFFTACKGRTYHLKETLPANIKDNESYPNLEFLILDYNSEDGLEEWIRQNFRSHIEEGRLTYIKTSDPQYWFSSHARNIACKKAEGDILCSVDADNFIGKNFAHYLNDEFNKDANIFLAPDRRNNPRADTFGRICFKKEDFFKIRGYDESIVGWGFEDTDMVYRLKNLGLRKVIIDNHDFLNAIEHANGERIEKQKNYAEIKSIYALSRKDEIDFIFLYKDMHFEIGTIELNSPKMIEFTGHKGSILKAPGWKRGQWYINGSEIYFLSKKRNRVSQIGSIKTNLRDGEESLIIGRNIYVGLKDYGIINYAIMTNQFVKNYQKFKDNCLKKNKIVNPNTFGIADVEINFSKEAVYCNS